MTDKPRISYFRITLKENGIHSLWKGLEAFEEYSASQDQMLLKDAIIFIHHGVELLMKEILAKNSQFLIFEDLRDATRKQKRADELEVGIFFLENPPRTVTFAEAVRRVDAFMQPEHLNHALIADLDRLNSHRNQLEHYAIEADVDEIGRLLASVREPLLGLFDSQLGGIRQKETKGARRAWQKAEQSAKRFRDIEDEVRSVLLSFNGQVLPGKLFGLPGELTVPQFEQVLVEPPIEVSGRAHRVDILAKSAKEDWIVEIKPRGLPKNFADVLWQMATYVRAHPARPWIIVFDDLSADLAQRASKKGFLVSGMTEWQEIKRTLAD